MREWLADSRATLADASPWQGVESAPAPAPNQPMGVLSIRRLGLEAPVFSGTGADTLKRGAGWIAGTALPGSRGNAGIAAHRDTLFRPLKDIRRGDEIEWFSPGGVRRYRVVWTKIVQPEDVHVLDGTPNASLTLVSCYPFYFIGSAPQRFIVRAEAETSARSDPPATVSRR